MKIAITGHTQGIGESLAKKYHSLGHTVLGFSKSTGYDIRDINARNKIVKEIVDCDMFINNAYGRPEGDFAQVELLFEVWKSWQGQQKIIANIGSSLTMRWRHDEATLAYRTSKRALEDACDFLWNKSAWPQISLISPCMTDTPRNHNKSDPNKVDPDGFAEMFYHAMSQKDFRVQVLKLAVNPM